MTMMLAEEDFPEIIIEDSEKQEEKADEDMNPNVDEAWPLGPLISKKFKTRPMKAEDLLQLQKSLDQTQNEDQFEIYTALQGNSYNDLCSMNEKAYAKYFSSS